MSVSVWLKPYNQTELDSLVRAVCNSNSSSYREWLSDADWQSQYAPSADD
ncbi:MAG: hypothetical protein JO108_11950, partial [Acidobacteriaceae bacterium]|nr:hypothetical protein [Acidobacteriaceae bacterium]